MSHSKKISHSSEKWPRREVEPRAKSLLPLPGRTRPVPQDPCQSASSYQLPARTRPVPQYACQLVPGAEWKRTLQLGIHMLPLPGRTRALSGIWEPGNPRSSSGRLTTITPARLYQACTTRPLPGRTRSWMKTSTFTLQVFAWFCGVMDQSRQRKRQIPITPARSYRYYQGPARSYQGSLPIILRHDMSYTSQKAFVSIKAISGQKTSAQPSKCHGPF